MEPFVGWVIDPPPEEDSLFDTYSLPLEDSLFQFVMGGRIGITAWCPAQWVFTDPCLSTYFF
jgi:hypothetical protein